MRHFKHSLLLNALPAILLIATGVSAEQNKMDSASMAEESSDSTSIVSQQTNMSLPNDDNSSRAGNIAPDIKKKAKSPISIRGRLDYRVLQIMDISEPQKNAIIWGDERQMERMWHHQLTGDALLTLNTAHGFTFSAGYRSGVSLYNTGAQSVITLGTTAIVPGSGFYQCEVMYGIPHFQAEVGIFQLKYNSDSKNLGEYLIKSSAYPGYVFSGREWAINVGAHIRTDIVPNLVQDILFVAENDHKPYNDFSPGYLFAYTIADAFTIGGGIMLHRFVQPQPENTTPPDENKVSYTHRGIKVMGRLAFDIKKLFGGPGIFGENDLRLYTEAAILGVKDYPVYYEHITRRVPVMGGINIPTFGLLDYCAVEMEWYGSEYINVPPDIHRRAIPLNKQRNKEDDIKWSVSMQRTVTKGVAFDARIASDHLRLESASGGIEELNRFDSWRQWYWSGGVSFSF